MSTLTKADLIDQVSIRLGIPKRDAKEFVQSFFDAIVDGLLQGHHVRLSGFGNFCLRDKSERPGRNPRTGESVAISARRVVTFKPGEKLRNRVDTIIKNKPSEGDDGRVASDS